MKKGVFRPTIPAQRERLRTLDRLGAPDFTGLTCPTCSAGVGEYCTRGFAHKGRIDRALRIAYGQEVE